MSDDTGESVGLTLCIVNPLAASSLRDSASGSS